MYLSMDAGRCVCVHVTCLCMYAHNIYECMYVNVAMVYARVQRYECVCIWQVCIEVNV